MKRFFLIATFVASTFTSFSQALEYKDLAILFSKNEENGTARFTSMSGAFGALGGDMSAVNINPAGLGIFNNNKFSGTIANRNTDINTTYYGNSITTKDEFFNISQAGAVLVLETNGRSEWNKFAIGFNYRINKDFTNSFVVEGNSNFATFNKYPLDTNNPVILYNNSNNQSFTNSYGGEISEFNFAVAGVHQNNLYVGASFNTYDLTFNQKNVLRETNNDGNGNTLQARFYQENFTRGVGVSLSAGFIYKAHRNFRFGASYQTPTWFTEIEEETNITDNEGFNGDTEITVSNNNVIYDNTADAGSEIQRLVYRLKTPGKLTASAGFIFNKKGLISIDYTLKNYSKLKLSNSNFSNENQYFLDKLKTTHSVNIGTEWRLDRFSIRGGYKFEQDPYKEAFDTDNITGYSLGGGYNFGKIKLDVAYTNNNKTEFYDVYPQYSNNVKLANLKTDNRKFIATLTFDL